MDILSFLISALISFLVAFFLVLTKNWHGAHSLDPYLGVQKIHESPTPRIGGVSIYLALVFANYLAGASINKIITPIILAGSVAFVVGLLEDLTNNIGVPVRLFATMISGFFAWYLTDYSLTRLDIPYIDTFLKYMTVSVLFTAFAVSGIANAINIIDGLNGLSSSVSILGFIGLALISIDVGDIELANASMILAFSVLGFMFMNWPFGKIFLGDGGAYFLGFALAWISVLLAERHGNVSAFVPVLICIYPITEVIFSIYRRKLRHAPLGHPDRLHLHSLFISRFINKKYQEKSKLVRNSIAGILIGMTTIIPVIISYYTYYSTRITLIVILFMIFIYVFCYFRLISVRRKYF
jgi:UDP-N-acetylmuramyl pentapeptide phosphotransferase/UDP-N-acetylglucosamine-1-phosphate transferase